MKVDRPRSRRKASRAGARPMPSALARDGLERLLAEVVFDAVWERDMDSEIVSWGGNLESIFGYPRDEVPDHVGWWRDRVHAEDLARVERGFKQALRRKARGYSTEYRFQRQDGTWAWV